MQSDERLHPSAVQRRQLLYELKKSVDLWFLSRRDCFEENVDNSESFFRVLLCIRNVLLDGLYKNSGIEGETACSELITQLNWLTPSIYGDTKECSFPSFQLTDPLAHWIYENFLKSTLCARLQLLAADLELLTTFYSDDAFLSNDRYATALFICLSAIELNQSSLISQIDRSLYAAYTAAVGKHQRSNSHPHFSISPGKVSQTSFVKEDSVDSTSESINSRRRREELFRIRKWKSLPNVQMVPAKKRCRSKTISQPTSSHDLNSSSSNLTPFLTTAGDSAQNCSFQELIPKDYQMPSTSRQFNAADFKPISLVKCDDIEIHFDQGHDHNRKASPDERPELIEYDTPPKPAGPIHFLSCISTNLFSIADYPAKDQNVSVSSSFANTNDFMSAFLPQEGQKLKRLSHSFFEDLEENPQSLLERRLPSNGQSLASFLQSVKYSRNNTDLERENAHFSMSEAIICVIEKMKCSKAERKRQVLENGACPKKPGRSKSPRGSRISIPRPTGSWSKSQSSFGASSFSEVDDSFDDSDLLTDGSLDDHCDDLMKDLMQSSESTNDHTAYAEWGGENTLEALSAEGVALSIISKFSDYQLPRASDLTWLVSRKDAPQDLLPLPGSPSADPDENYVPPVLRGTRDWAPPRQQIIFTNHQNPNRKQLLQQQNYRCTGCGMRVSRSYMNRFRYCTYLGKYHCTGCHRNQMSIIPAKVLERWDFCYYPVSVFAYRLLEQIWTYPLFYVPDLNPALYTKIKTLSISRLKRMQLKFIQDFIITCRFALEEKTLFDNIAAYITLDPDKWSMFDFLAAKEGSFPKTVSNLISKCEKHVYNCELCTARGFICEVCPKKQIIFPWQNRVKRCDDCGTCFHQKCWENILGCVKCERLRSRMQKVG